MAKKSQNMLCSNHMIKGLGPYLKLFLYMKTVLTYLSNPVKKQFVEV